MAADQWTVVRECINWQSWLTMKANMPGRVKVQYWRAPTMLLYSDGLESGSLEYCDNLRPDAIGIAHGLAPTILQWWRISTIYLVWERYVGLCGA